MALSPNLIHSLAALLPRSPSLVLSIGSGKGYLENLLLQHVGDDSLDLRGVEVSPSVNKYMPEQNMVFVKGTWDLYSNAAVAEVLMFVYPREPRLVARYINTIGGDALKMIVYIGPTQDWPDYEGVLLSSSFHCITVPENCGVAEYEMVCLATKSHKA